MDLRAFYEGLDALFAQQKTKEAGEWLAAHHRQAMEEKDEAGLLAVLNEEIGYFRSTGRAEEGCRLFEEARLLAEEMGLADTQSYATTLLNGATAYRAAGTYEKAAGLYRQARQAYRAAGVTDSYEIAGLYNNESLLLEKQGRTAEARRCLEQAIDILERIDGTDTERATSLTNLALLHLQEKNIGEAQECLKAAQKLFEDYEARGGGRDAHYGAALAGMAQVRYELGDYAEAAELYGRACEETKRSFGENDAYRILRENEEEARRRQEEETAQAEPIEEEAKGQHHRSDDSEEAGTAEVFVQGMDICREYYSQRGRELLSRRFPQLFDRMTIGLAGHGSECYGYDDGLSGDHDYGPSFCIWLDREDYVRFGGQVQEVYDSLPGEFMGLGPRQVSARGQGRVGVCCTEAFYGEMLGMEAGPRTEDDWRRLSDKQLACAANGQIFKEGKGKFLEVRRTLLAYYPRTVWLQKIGVQAALMAQSGQYNYPRLMMRRDSVGASLALGEFLKAAAGMCYLLNRVYMPYYKWIFRGMQDFERLRDVADYMEELVRLPDQEEAWRGMSEEDYRSFLNVRDYRVVYIETICRRVREELRVQGLSTCRDPFLENHVQEILSHIGERQERRQ